MYHTIYEWIRYGFITYFASFTFYMLSDFLVTKILRIYYFQWAKSLP